MTPFIAAINLFLGRKSETSKNALKEVYYNLTLQVLSDEYTDYVAKFNPISDLAAETNIKLQRAIRSNKLEREEDEKNAK